MALVLTTDNGNGTKPTGDPSAVIPALKLTRKRRGRTPQPGQDPTPITEVLTVRRKPHSPDPPPPPSALDHYLDEEYLRMERLRRFAPADFHVSTHNEHDHTESVAIKVHEKIVNAIHAIFEAKEFPFVSENVIWNAAALDYLKRLYYLIWKGKQEQYSEDGQVPETAVYRPPSWVGKLESISAIHYRYKQMMDFQHTVNLLHQQVGELRSKLGAFGDDQAVQLISEVRAQVKGMRNQEWGRWYLEQIDERYGELLEKRQVRVKVKRGV